MKNTFKTGAVLIMALAVFALTFTGCKKKNDDSGSSATTTTNNSGGNGGGGNPSANYGTLQIGNNDYTIAIGGYELYYDDELSADVALLGVTDAEENNGFGVLIPYFTTIPTGTFTFSTSDPIPEGSCLGAVHTGDNDLACLSGSVTVTSVNNNYRITASGTAAGQGIRPVEFSVEFVGPLVEQE